MLVRHAVTIGLALILSAAFPSLTFAQCDPCDVDCDGLSNTPMDAAAFMALLADPDCPESNRCSPCVGDFTGFPKGVGPPDGCTTQPDLGRYLDNCFVDCDLNGLHDLEDILRDPGLDTNGNNILDSCEPVCSLPNCGACCLSPEQCIFTTQADCTGTYLGDGVDCNNQVTKIPIHTATQWSHTITVETDCPPAGGLRGAPGCVSGPAFIDPWVTEDTCTSCEDFSSPDACPIPADFFGPGSDPFTGVICFEGDPLGVVTVPGFPDPLDFGTADTLIRRTSDPFDRCELPSATPVVVNIVMEQLSLVSCVPMTVTFNGGQTPESWDVRVQVLDSTGQPGGTLTATKTHCNGGTFDSSFTVCPQFIFTKVDPPFTQMALDFCVDCNAAGITMTANNVDWVGDLDTSLGLVSPVCSGFHPSLSQSNPSTQCDCNGNGIRDACDIESDFSGDCNNNLTPDECDIAAQVSQDLNADGVPDECGVPIPATSDLSLICLTLLVLASVTIMLGRRRQKAI